MKNIERNEYLWISIHKTTDENGRQILNLIIDVFRSDLMSYFIRLKCLLKKTNQANKYY